MRHTKVSQTHNMQQIQDIMKWILSHLSFLLSHFFEFFISYFQYDFNIMVRSR